MGMTSPSQDWHDTYCCQLRLIHAHVICWRRPLYRQRKHLLAAQ